VQERPTLSALAIAAVVVAFAFLVCHPQRGSAVAFAFAAVCSFVVIP
jgi:hypothetical protein